MGSAPLPGMVLHQEQEENEETWERTRDEQDEGNKQPEDKMQQRESAESICQSFTRQRQDKMI